MLGLRRSSCPPVLLVAVLGPLGAAQEWTRFRGPDGAGRVEAPTVPTAFTQEDWNWRVKLAGSGHSSPVLWGERVFLTCASEGGERRWIVCHDTDDGRELWRYEDDFTPHRQHRFNSFASATPTVDESRVYLAWTDGASFRVLALDHEGEEVWQRELGSFQAQHGSGTSPILVGDILIVSNDHEADGSFLIGLDPETGETLWDRERRSSRAAYSTPILLRPAEGEPQVVFSSTSHGITGLDPVTGELLWEQDAGFEERCVGSPVAAGGIVFATAGSGGGGKESIAVVPGDATAQTAPRVAWQLRRALPYVPTPVAAFELLFLWTDGGVVTCVRPATGETVWQERAGGNYFGSPVCIDDRIFIMSRDGELVVIRAAETYEPLARIELGEPSHATPAVAGGVLYLRTERHLISVGGPQAKTAGD